MSDIFEVQIINREYVHAEWTMLEGKLPEGVYLLRAQDSSGKWFDRKARFERNKGWTEVTAEEWANKRRPFQIAGPTQKDSVRLSQILKDAPKLTEEEMKRRDEERLIAVVEARKTRRFSLDRILGRKTKEDVVLERWDPSEVKLNHIYNGDSINVMELMPSNYFDAVVTDPPYNLGKKYKSGIDDAKRAQDYYEWSFKWIDEAVRVLTPHGQLFIALWDTFKYDIATYINRQHSSKLRFIQEIAWETTGVPRPGSGKLRSDITPWLHYGPSVKKGKPRVNYTYNIDNVRSWKFVKHTDVVKKNARYIHPLGKDAGTLWRFFKDEEWEGDEAQNFYVLNWFRKFLEHVAAHSMEHTYDLFDVPSNVVSKRNLPTTHRDRLDHPCQMPVEVPMRIIELATNPGAPLVMPAR